MIIYTAIDTEEKTVSVWTDDSTNYYTEWEKVEFDSMNIGMLVNDINSNTVE